MGGGGISWDPKFGLCYIWTVPALKVLDPVSQCLLGSGKRYVLNFCIGMELGGSKHVERVQVVKECLVPKVCQVVPN